MNLILTRLLKSIPHLNRRELTEVDFYKLCKKERIKLAEVPLKENIYGYYTNVKGKAYIVINRNLSKMRWLEVAFHELGHHFLHAPVPSSVFFDSQNLTHRQELEAQTLALLALIPKTILEELECNSDLVFDYPLHLVEERIKLFHDFKV